MLSQVYSTAADRTIDEAHFSCFSRACCLEWVSHDAVDGRNPVSVYR